MEIDQHTGLDLLVLCVFVIGAWVSEDFWFSQCEVIQIIPLLSFLLTAECNWDQPVVIIEVEVLGSFPVLGYLREVPDPSTGLEVEVLTTFFQCSTRK